MNHNNVGRTRNWPVTETVELKQAPFVRLIWFVLFETATYVLHNEMEKHNRQRNTPSNSAKYLNQKNYFPKPMFKIIPKKGTCSNT